jgi:phosphoglycerate dehydrogenase-like enzyme
MTPTILSLSPLPKGALDMYLSPHLGGLSVDIQTADGLDTPGLKAAFSKADVVLGDYTFVKPITAELISAAAKLKLIQQPSVGYQHIDIDACRLRQIPVANAAGANDKSVAEHTFALALALLKKLSYFHDRTRSGVWTQMEAFEIGVTELAGKTWGIVGMGHIGREVAKRAQAFDAQIVYYDVAQMSEADEKALGATFMPMEKLVRKADVISLHAPLTDTTKGMISARLLSIFKPTAILINVARGELVDATALVQALNNKRIAGAGLDVFAPEPPPASDPLLSAKNVLLTPHIAGTTNEARSRIVASAVGNVARVLRGEKPINVVNGVVL